MSKFVPANNLDRDSILYLKDIIEKEYYNNQKELDHSPFMSTDSTIIIHGEYFRIEIMPRDDIVSFKFFFLEKLKYEYKWQEKYWNNLLVNRHGMNPQSFLDLVVYCLESCWGKKLEKLND